MVGFSFDLSSAPDRPGSSDSSLLVPVITVTSGSLLSEVVSFEVTSASAAFSSERYERRYAYGARNWKKSLVQNYGSKMNLFCFTVKVALPMNLIFFRHCATITLWQAIIWQYVLQLFCLFCLINGLNRQSNRVFKWFGNYWLSTTLDWPIKVILETIFFGKSFLNTFNMIIAQSGNWKSV